METVLSHPATVHVPLALAVLIPIAFVLAWWATEKNWLPENFGWVFVGLAALVLGSSAFAFITGEQSKVMSAAKPELLASHEQRAQVFCAVWVVILFIAGLTQSIGKSRALGSRGVLLLLLILQAVLGVQLGRLGGQIVFGAL